MMQPKISKLLERLRKRFPFARSRAPVIAADDLSKIERQDAAPPAGNSARRRELCWKDM